MSLPIAFPSHQCSPGHHLNHQEQIIIYYDLPAGHLLQSGRRGKRNEGSGPVLCGQAAAVMVMVTGHVTAIDRYMTATYVMTAGGHYRG